MSSRSYLSEKKLAQAKAAQKAMFIAGGIISGLFALMFPLAFTTNPELQGYLPVYGVCIVPGLFLIWGGVRRGRQMDLARRFDSIFSCDRDGFVTLGELTRQSGKGEQETLRILEKLFQKGYFENCTLHRAGRSGVELTDAAIGDGAEGFVAVKCDQCGGTTRIRQNTIGKCEFCGSPIRAKTD